MGSCSFRKSFKCYSKNLFDVIEDFKKDSKDRYGDDYYAGDRGSIAYVCFKRNVVKFADKYKSSSEMSAAANKKLEKLIEELTNKANKNEAYIIDLGVINYATIKMVKKVSTKSSSPKYGFVFNIIDIFGRTVKSCKTKIEAEKYIEKEILNGKVSELSIKKEKKIISGSEQRITYSAKTTVKKSKPRSGDFLENHAYIMVGWAGC